MQIVPMLNNEDDEEYIEFAFFMPISTSSKSYFCDFHAVQYPDGAHGYRVLIHPFDNKDIVVDIRHINNKWQVTNDAIAPELIEKLIQAIDTYTKE